MPTSYTIGSHFEALIQRLLKGGRYSTASEVVRDGLRLIEERESIRQAKLAALRTEIRKGLDSGPVRESDIAELVGNVKARGRQRRASARHGS
ncbi:MAG TPA: type II toxin-antitoxin system ParD family antitoxin [Xanthobacteraceae bacterium]